MPPKHIRGPPVYKWPAGADGKRRGGEKPPQCHRQRQHKVVATWPRKVSDHNPSNPAVWLLKGHDAAEAAAGILGLVPRPGRPGPKAGWCREGGQQQPTRAELRKACLPSCGVLLLRRLRLPLPFSRPSCNIVQRVPCAVAAALLNTWKAVSATSAACWGPLPAEVGGKRGPRSGD